MKWFVIDSGFSTGKMNMDIDISFTESCKSDEAIIRFYRWNPYCISLGANQKIDEINIGKANRDEIDVVHRPTGGRAILHAEELTYSVIYPIDEITSFRNLYHEINLALIKGLTHYNSDLAQLEMENKQPDFPSIYKSAESSLCFAFPAKSEIKLKGKKLVGSAQKKLRHALLQHGSILCGNYHLKIVDYLNLSHEESFLMKEELNFKTTDLFSILHQSIDYKELIHSLVGGFSDHFNVSMEIIKQQKAIF